MSRQFCPAGRARHWRIVWNTVGLRAPVCIYCGSPNPKPLSEDEWKDLLSHINAYGTTNRHLLDAIAKREVTIRKTFAHADYYSSKKAWGFIDHNGDFLPATALVGRVVNIGDKNGLTFDSTTVTSFGDRNGIFILDGGTFKHWMRDDEEPQPVEGFPMPMHEIARGYIHEEKPA